MKHRTAALAAAAAVLGLATSCVAAAVGAGVGYVVGSEASEAGMRRAEIKRDVMEVWYITKEVMGILSTTPIQISEEIPRTVEGTVDGARVNVRVMAWDLGRTRVETRAREFGLPDEPVAERVLATIVERAAPVAVD